MENNSINKKAYILFLENKEYELIMSLFESFIEFKLVPKTTSDYFYAEKFELSTINKNKYLIIDLKDLKNAFQKFDNLLNNKKVKLIQTRGDIITLNFQINLIDEILESNLELKQILIKNLILNLDSLIITDINNNSLLKNWINPNSKISANLLYRLSKDGSETKTYHHLCDNKGPTLHLFFLKIGDIVGFFANESIDSTSGWKKDSKCFVFNLTKKMQCTKMNLVNESAFSCKDNCGPSANGLGCNPDEDLNFIYHSADMQYTAFRNNFKNLLPSEGVEAKYEVKETEVYQIIM